MHKAKEEEHPNIIMDVTMTAVRRPSLLKHTLASFYSNLFCRIADYTRLIINVDPIGEDVRPQEMIEVASGFFGHIYVNFPSKPSFPEAFKWCWGKSDAPWVFHLEDDWKLLREVNILEMMHIMDCEPELASLRLPFFNATETNMKNWNIHFPWNGDYFECPTDRRKGAGFAGHPSLLRGKFVQRCAPLLDTMRNPEKQFHGGNTKLVNEVLNWKYGVYGEPNSPKILEDIGAEWKAKHNFRKSGNKAFFTQWEART